MASVPWTTDIISCEESKLGNYRPISVPLTFPTVPALPATLLLHMSHLTPAPTAPPQLIVIVLPFGQTPPAVPLFAPLSCFVLVASVHAFYRFGALYSIFTRVPRILSIGQIFWPRFIRHKSALVNSFVNRIYSNYTINVYRTTDFLQ